jgi:hypothetical protein
MPDELEGNLQDFFVTETVFDSKVPLETITEFLKRRRTTGKITTEQSLSQGGSQSVRVVERTKLTDLQAEKIRLILDMK